MKSADSWAEQCAAHIETGAFEWEQERPAVCGSGLVVKFVVRGRLIEWFGDQAEILGGAHF